MCLFLTLSQSHVIYLKGQNVHQALPSVTLCSAVLEANETDFFCIFIKKKKTNKPERRLLLENEG